MLFNKVIVAGRLGRDPEMNYTPNGKAYTRFSMAVDQGKDQPAMWLNVVCWDKIAERVAGQAHKGNEIFVEGRLTMRNYKDKSGLDRQAFEVIASAAQLTQRPVQNTSSNSNFDDLGDLDDHPF